MSVGAVAEGGRRKHVVRGAVWVGDRSELVIYHISWRGTLAAAANEGERAGLWWRGAARNRSG